MFACGYCKRHSERLLFLLLGIVGKMRVLITGATGSLGPSLVRKFCERGYQIRTFSLDSSHKKNLLPENLEVLTGDITNPETVDNIVNGVDMIVHLAALLHITNFSLRHRGECKRVNVGGTTNIVQAALKEGIRRVVLFSTISVYNNSCTSMLNELSPTLPQTDYARTKLAAEKIVLNARDTNNTQIGTVLRLGAVYGPRVKGNYWRMVSALARGRFIPVGDGFNRRTLVYDKDVAEAVVLAVEHPAAAGRIYNVTDGNVHTVKEIESAICRALGRKPPRFSLPVTPVRIAAGVLEQGARLLGCSSPVTRATVDKYTEDIAVDGSLIQKELGFVPKYNLDRGWQETIQEMRARGIL
jgi:UDP-glucose 4-epimerase